MVNQLLQQSKDWILKNKVATFLSVALFAMVITTIALAVSNNSNATDLEECQAEIDAFYATSTTVITSPGTTLEVTTGTETNDGTTTTMVSMETSPLPETTTTTTLPTTTSNPAVVNYRLPDDNIPLHYDLELHPDLVQDTFQGTVTITILHVRANEQVVLHSHLLDIQQIKFKCLNDSTTVYINSNYDDKLDFLKINLNKVVPQDYISELTITFSGKLNAGIVGFYSSSYTDENGSQIFPDPNGSDE
uniref:Aminopeptidase N-like N-terminal domain-containing protein n=1 Tax=Anopheles culicifacies TaxID=139723 RepID=A0A182LVW7_9DIPT